MKHFASVWVPFFAAAAEERCEPQLLEAAFAVLTGAPPATRVAEANAVARERGVAPGMTETEARTRCPSLVTRLSSPERLASARWALLEAAHAVSPRVEDVAPGLVDVDIAGLEGLIGDAHHVGEELARRARGVGLMANVGVAASRTVARIAARLGRRVSVVAPGHEASLLAGVPLATLDLPADLRATLGRWGVRTVGELAGLPRDALAARLGEPGLDAHDLALGVDRAPFRPWSPPRFYHEAQELDWEVDALAALAPVFRGVLDRLCARLEAGDVHADALTVQLELADRRLDERALVLASPMRDAALMLTLVKLDLEAHPPGAAVTAVAVTAHSVRARIVDGRLWEPAAPALRDLASVLARVAALVGVERVGAAQPVDTHRPDAFVLVPFAPPDARPADWRGGERTSAAAPTTASASRRSRGGAQDEGRPAGDGDERVLALRRLRPPRGVTVETSNGRPARIGWDRSAMSSRSSRVVRCAGPWRGSGDWWDAHAWARDEWDVSLADDIVCRLVHDRVTGQWSVDGVYD